jgi:hypothetical protein
MEMPPPPFGGPKHHHHHHHGHKGKHGKFPPFQMPYFFNPYGVNMQYYNGPESPNLTFGQDDYPTELEEFDPNTMPNVAEDEIKNNANTSATYAEVAAADAAADAAEGKDPAAPPKDQVPQVVPGFDL